MASDSQVRRAVAAEMRRDNQVAPAVSASAERITSNSALSLTEHNAETPQVDQATTELSPRQDIAENVSTSGYSRVTAEQAGEILRLRKVNPDITYEQIAAAIGVKSVSTVSYWLKKLEHDTVPESRKLAKSNALRAVMKLEDQIDHSDPRVSQGAAKAITALAGVQEGAQPVAVGVQVIVGTLEHPAGPDPFITASVNQSSQVLDS